MVWGGHSEITWRPFGIMHQNPFRVSSGALCPLGGHRCVVAAAMRRIGGIALRQSLSHSRGPGAELSRVSCIPDECPRPRPGMITTRLRKGLREAQQTQKRVAAENPTAHVDAHRELGKRVVRRYRSPDERPCRAEGSHARGCTA